MDTATHHLLMKLDMLREAQLSQNAISLRILAAVEAMVTATNLAAKTTSVPLMPSPKTGVMNAFIAQLKSIQYSSVIVRGALMWGVGAAISSYLSNGGDPLKAAEVLVKLFW